MKFSIITPSYNQGEFIKRTLESVADQRNYISKDIFIEHIIIDGQSTDQTLTILKSFPNISWISEKDNGQAHAVNKGIQMSSGEIIGWLNSDDIYYPETISKVAQIFSNNPKVDVIYGQADHIDTEDKAFEKYPSEDWNFANLKNNCFICQPTVFFRRKLIYQYGLLDEKLIYCMDYEYWLRLGKDGVKFYYVKDKLAGSRLYPTNKTLGARVKVHAEINSMLKNLFGMVPDRWLFNYAHVVAETKYNREVHPRKFILVVILLSTFVSLRWNHGISTILPPLSQWFFGLLKAR